MILPKLKISNNEISPWWNSFFTILLMLIIVLVLLTITILRPSKSISQITGPAIGGVIAVFAGYFFTKWEEEQKKSRKKQFSANVFLFELRKIQKFIEGIEKLNIRSEDFLITRPPLTNGGIITRDPRPEWDEYKRLALLKYFHDNDHIRITESAYLISKKSPFEIFAQEIYIFQDGDLIFDLLKVDSLMNEANSCLVDFHKIWETSDGHKDLFNFMTKIQRVKPEIDKILSEGKLESIAKVAFKNPVPNEF